MPEITPSKYLVQASWDDVPHLSEKTKRELLAATLPHLRKARTQGIPSLGSGAIYPIDVEEISVNPFRIPDYWPRAYGMDVGWNRTAAVWGAWDRSTDTVYLYTEHYMGEAKPPVHVSAVKARGEWVPGVIDPAAKGRSQEDGRILLETYKALGLDLAEADNAVEAGIYVMYDRFSTGRLKIFSTCQNLLAEYRIYRRDEKGHIVKKFDHALDAARYLCMSGLARAIVVPSKSASSGRSGVKDARAGY